MLQHGLDGAPLFLHRTMDKRGGVGHAPAPATTVHGWRDSRVGVWGEVRGPAGVYRACKRIY